VWLARDLKHNTFVALKVQKSAQHYLEAAYDEVEILDVIAKNTDKPEWIRSLLHYYKDEPERLKQGAVSDHCHNVMLLNSFMFDGPNGKHFVMVFEILGVNLLEIMKRYDYKGIPIPLVRRLAK
jgi:serine/threonine-protein kinase SRPK3